MVVPIILFSLFIFNGVLYYLSVLCVHIMCKIFANNEDLMIFCLIFVIINSFREYILFFSVLKM